MIRAIPSSLVGAVLGLALTGCHHAIPPIHDPPRSVAVTTGGPSGSVVYLAWVEAGVIVIDMGWWDADGAIRDGLSTLGANSSDVLAVFLTHAHRDHVGGWRTLRHAPFWMGVEEIDRFHGIRPYAGSIPRLAAWVKPPERPAPAEVDARGFSADTMFVFGSDTVRAFSVPGHTMGSTAYLFRGILFVGDAVTHSHFTGYGPARRIHSDDPDRARASLEALWPRVASHRPRVACTAHGWCGLFGPEFIDDVGPD